MKREEYKKVIKIVKKQGGWWKANVRKGLIQIGNPSENDFELFDGIGDLNIDLMIEELDKLKEKK